MGKFDMTPQGKGSAPTVVVSAPVTMASSMNIDSSQLVAGTPEWDKWKGQWAVEHDKNRQRLAPTRPRLSGVRNVNPILASVRQSGMPNHQISITGIMGRIKKR